MAQAKLLLPRRDPSDPAYVFVREKLISARKATGLTQQALAEIVGRPQSFVAKIERGERYIDLIEAIALASILGLSVDELTPEI